MLGPHFNRYNRSVLFEGRPLSLFIENALHDPVEPAHDHDFMEVVLVLEGSAEHHSAQGVQTLGPGDVVVLRPGAWHAYLSCQALSIMNCCFGDDVFQQVLDFALRNPAMNHLLRVHPLSAERHGLVLGRIPLEMLNRCADQLRTLEAQLKERSEARPSRLVLHLLLILEEVAAHITTSSPQELPLPRRTSAAIARAVHLLEEDLTYDWSLAELAERLNLAPAYFVRVFKPATGLSPMAYLARLRAERAAELLIRTDLPVADIAARVGWPSPDHFARRFRQHFNVSASQYRARFTRTVNEPSGVDVPTSTL
ncbi:AraC family transcriptional regulator [Deinococcus pimensis]|uniref:AraC family transcriptional regulator n=1 Tax=Deinococcus pimensis TaxID=309888 RepID=UPI0004AE4AEF|nr:AraC family transcriptional regulator [Deinococcus pimensis]